MPVAKPYALPIPEPKKCRDRCGLDATQRLYSSRSVFLGYYCDKHGAIRLDNYARAEETLAENDPRRRVEGTGYRRRRP